MNQTLEAIKNEKIIAIIRGIPTSLILKTAQSLLDGGIRLMEITFNQESAETLQETVDSIRLVHEQLGDQVLLGAGTVTTPEQVDMAKECGALYIISPNVEKDVIHRTREQELLSIPGAFTPSEIAEAYQAGAHIVKLFPAGLLGTAYLKAVRGPLSHIPMSAVGGIDAANIADFLKAGACCVGIGGSLVSRSRVLAGKFDEITEYAKTLVKAAAEE